MQQTNSIETRGAFHNATLVQQVTLKGDYCLLKIAAPELTGLISAGQLIHFTESKTHCSLPLMHVHQQEGEIDLLYKAGQRSTQFLSKKRSGDKLALKAPIGETFQFNKDKKRPLLIGHELGMSSMIFFAEQLKNAAEDCAPLVFLGSEKPFPFTAKPSQIMINGMPVGVIASMPLLEDWNIACRLTSQQDYPGCFDGRAIELAKNWLATLDHDQLAEVEIFSCGSESFVTETTELAENFSLPYQATSLDL